MPRLGVTKVDWTSAFDFVVKVNRTGKAAFFKSQERLHSDLPLQQSGVGGFYPLQVSFERAREREGGRDGEREKIGRASCRERV